jgi:hypothetical protein
MVADILTKPLTRVKFTQFWKMMGVISPDEEVHDGARIEGEC